MGGWTMRHAKRLTIADLEETKRKNKLENQFEKIKKLKREKEEDMEFQQELSQHLAKKEAAFTEQWKVRNPGVLDNDLATESAQPLADQGGVLAIATQPASPASLVTSQATRQPPTKEEKSRVPPYPGVDHLPGELTTCPRCELPNAARWETMPPSSPDLPARVWLTCTRYPECDFAVSRNPWNSCDHMTLGRWPGWKWPAQAVSFA